MFQAVRNLVKRISSNPPPATSDESGIREMPKVGDNIHVRDNETMVVPCMNETDLMVKLSIQCPFLSHKHYQLEVSDYLFAHFDEVFTFHPVTGKATHHTR